MREVKDFIIGGSPINQICPLAAANNVLNDLTAPETGLSDRNGRVFVPDPDPDSISDIIAHFIHFSQLLIERDAVAEAEWRGMLCDIFFDGMISGNHSVNSISINSLSEFNTDCVRVIKDRMVKNRTKTGFDENVSEFQFYCKDVRPFAMIVPELVLIPLCNYDRSIFNASPWVNRDNHRWSNDAIQGYFRDRPSYAPLMIQYLMDLIAVAGIRARQPLMRFIEDLCTLLPPDYALPNAGSVGSYTVRQKLGEGYVAQLPDNTRKLMKGDCWQSDLLCFKPYVDTNRVDDNFIENTQVQPTHHPWENYRIDFTESGSTENTLLTPVKIYGFCRENADIPIYVIPPVNNDMLQAVANGQVTVLGWSASLVEGDTTCTRIMVTMRVSIGGQEFPPSRKIYNCGNIFIADRLPYISMWPYAVAGQNSPEWSEYYVSSIAAEYAEELPDFPRIDEKIRNGGVTPMRSMPLNRIAIHVYGDAERYEIHANPFGADDADINSNINVMRTKHFPEYILISGTDADNQPVSFGCWQINKNNAISLQNGNRRCTIGFDFATSSTVVSVAVETNNQGNYNRPIYVDAPGNYLYDVFNPLFIGPNCPEDMRTDLEKNKKFWRQIQDYYLFGGKTGDYHKIYSYGQLHRAIKKGDGGKKDEAVGADINYVSGRAVHVSNRYMQEAIMSSKLNFSSIYSPIKWSDPNAYDNKYRAANNFVMNALTWGLLTARRLGSVNVAVHASYPLGSEANFVENGLNDIIVKLEKISGLNAITYRAFSEAEANAKYLIEGGARGWHDTLTIPNHENGFMLVDIGGGSTDVAVCQYEDDHNVRFEDKIKAQCSFKYAGRELVDISLLKIADFEDMWTAREPENDGELASLLSKFTYDRSKPNAFSPDDNELAEFGRLISFVGFLLDSAVLNQTHQGVYIGNRLDSMKFKFLALFWVFGRYIAKLQKADKLKGVDGIKAFNIYLTGCASNAVKSLCSQNDRDFVAKCAESASRGFFSLYPDVTMNRFICVYVVTDDKGKREVSFGLTGFEPQNGVATATGGTGMAPLTPLAPLAPLTNFGTPPGFAKEENSESDDTVVKPDVPDFANIHVKTDEAYEDLNQIFTVINYMYPKVEYITPDYIKNNGIHSRVNEWMEHPTHRTKIENKMKNEFIMDELFALYIFEKFLDELV